MIENYALLGNEKNTQKVEVKTLEQFIIENKIETGKSIPKDISNCPSVISFVLNKNGDKSYL